MTSAIVRTHATFTPRIGSKLVSLSAPSSNRPAPASQKSRSFLAALLKALSAFAA